MSVIEKVTFQPNMPVRMALKFRDGKKVEGRFGDQEYYTLIDGRGMYLDLDVAAKLNVLELQPGEPFEVCKYWTGKKGDKPQWDVRRVNGAPPARPALGASPPQNNLERDLARSLELGRGGQPGADARTSAPEAAAPISLEQPPQHNNNGNGSKPSGHGNGNGSWVGIATAVPVPVKIPLNVAFREILAFCTQELQAAHEQWSDNARQDLVSTLLIQAAREGWCTVWERGSK